MHGVLLAVDVNAGQEDSKNTRLGVLEAMNMQHELLSPVDGTVNTIHVTADTQVAAGDLLIEIDVVEAD